MFLQETESVDALAFHKLPDCISDILIDFLMTELPDDSPTHPKKATKLILLERPNEFLCHRTQQRQTVYTIRIDNVFEIFGNRLGYVLRGTIDGKCIAKGRP
jgi:hypothetical protein